MHSFAEVSGKGTRFAVCLGRIQLLLLVLLVERARLVYLSTQERRHEGWYMLDSCMHLY